jgi:hypothetical protein
LEYTTGHRQRIGNRHMKRDVARFRLVQIGWWEPPHSCGGARLSSRAARVGLFSSGFSRGVLKPGLKPDGSKRDSFRDAEASLPLLKQGAPTDSNQPGFGLRQDDQINCLIILVRKKGVAVT